MTCREALELMGDQTDGTLGGRDRWRLRLHVAICRICRRYLLSYRAAVRIAKLTRLGANDATDEQLPDAVVESILNARRGP